MQKGRKVPSESVVCRKTPAWHPLQFVHLRRDRDHRTRLLNKTRKSVFFAAVPPFWKLHQLFAVDGCVCCSEDWARVSPCPRSISFSPKTKWRWVYFHENIFNPTQSGTSFSTYYVIKIKTLPKNYHQSTVCLYFCGLSLISRLFSLFKKRHNMNDWSYG